MSQNNVTLFHPPPPFPCIGVFLDRFTGAARLGGRIPADAIGDHPPGGRFAPADGQHLHLPAVYTALLQQSGPAAQAPASDQDKELWIRVRRSVSISRR